MADNRLSGCAAHGKFADPTPKSVDDGGRTALDDGVVGDFEFTAVEVAFIVAHALPSIPRTYGAVDSVRPLGRRSLIPASFPIRPSWRSSRPARARGIARRLSLPKTPYA